MRVAVQDIFDGVTQAAAVWDDIVETANAKAYAGLAD